MSRTKYWSRRFVPWLAVLAGLLLVVFVTAVLAAVGVVNIVSPTGGVPFYRQPGDTFDVTYDAAGDEVATVNFYLGATKIGSETVSLGFANRITTLTIPGGTAEGKYDLKVEAVGSTTEDDVEPEAVIVDSTAPAVTIDNIPDWVSALANVTGTSSDATSGVALMEVRIRRASDSKYWTGAGWQDDSIWPDATGTTSWSYPDPGWADGEAYTVCARGTDEAGNVTASGDQPCDTFTYDTNDVSVTITDPPTGDQNSVPSLAGTASDTGSGVASVEVQVYNVTGARYWNGAIWTATASWNNASYAAGAWTYTMPTLTSGREYQVTAKATDVAGNFDTDGPHTFCYDDVDPTVAITMPAPGTEYYNTMDEFAGTADDDTQGFAPAGSWGVDKVEVKLQRLSDNKWWDDSVPGWEVAEKLLSAVGTTAWTYDAITVTYGDGVTYEVWAKSTDKAGNDPWVSDQFTIDDTAPDATMDGINAEVGCAFDEISGSSSDATSGVDEVYVTISNTVTHKGWDGDSWEDAETWLLASGTTAWTYDVSDVTFENGDGYQVWAKAKDNVALETAGGDQPTDTFTYDECPTVAFTAPAADANLNDLDEITGTAVDSEAVVEVQVQIQQGLTSEYWNGASWQGTEAWVNAVDTSVGGTWATWEYDTSGIDFPDEGYILRAKSKDDFGQWSDVASRGFTFDATAPSATIYSISDPSKPTEFAGTANDPGSSGLDEVYVKIYNVTDGDWYTGAAWGAETWLSAAGTENWTYNVPGTMETGDQYTVSAKAEDKAGNETAAGDQPSRTFTYGTDGPSANIDLGAGWNLMSLPLIPNDTNITAVLADLIATNKVDWVTTFVWEGGGLTEKRWDPPIEQLTTMTTGQGYWVKMFEQGILVNAGKFQPDPPNVPMSHQVYAGWNMIGYHTTTQERLDEAEVLTLEEYLGDTLGPLVRAAYYYDGVYKIATGEDMKVGFGYWVALDAGGTIYP